MAFVCYFDFSADIFDGQVLQSRGGSAPQRAISLPVLEAVESVVGLAIPSQGSLEISCEKRKNKTEDDRTEKSRSKGCQGLKPAA